MQDSNASVQNFILKQLVLIWDSPKGASLSAFFLTLFAYLGLLVARPANPLDPFTILPPLCIGLGTIFVWREIHGLRSTPRDKVGIVVAITADKDDEARTVEADFTREFISKLQSNAGSNFAIIKPPGYLLARIDENERYAETVVRKCKAHFLLRGYARRRPNGGKDQHILKLDALVRHGQIPTDLSNAFAKEMRLIIPKDHRVDAEFAVDSFEATAAHIALSAKFVIGVAAGLTGDLRYAEKLLVEVEHEINRVQPTPDALRKLAEIVPIRLADLYRRFVDEFSILFRLQRKKEILVRSEPYCDRLLARCPADYSGLLHKAMISFVLRRDMAAARSLLNRCKSHFSTHHFSRAFLLGYEGKLQEAHDEYRRGLNRKSHDETVGVQTEEFMLQIMEEEPERRHLLFCTALVNYNIKKDFEAARRDFREFLSLQNIDDFPWAKAKAKLLLDLCESADPEQLAD